MSTSAWIMFVVGAGIIWGGFGGFSLCCRLSIQQNGSTEI